MSDMDKLRMLRSSALEARRRHIAQTLGATNPPASASRLGGLQRMILRVEQALGRRTPKLVKGSRP
ncbi:hypothetical protein NON00_10640 [Roseomonas sp. GC11]|uniref:hypothetical protein n=1 Tax=Roseomonas sp. GC11 TaxID=2950546 RepID=UPI00210C857F|nr:hypothetical protein [Roseomonas sp. GC11]MCQ4160385.1 hypothetical protein [Roseomonas sp. GC11]